MKRIEYLLISGILICSYNIFGQWTEVSSIQGRSIHTLNFLDDDLGYALMIKDPGGAATIEKTINGGNNWTELNLAVQSGEFQDIYFYAEGEGVVLVRDLSNDVVPTKIFQTMDDGASWQDISPDATVNGVGVGQCQFLNQNTGYFATERNLYTTLDGGENWNLIEFNEYILSLDFLDANHGTIGTWDGTFAYKGGMQSTSDGGATWTNNLLTEAYTSIGEVRRISNSLAFASPVHSWASINAGQFYKTTDSGANWSNISIPEPTNNSTLRQIDFKDEMNGVICVGDNNTTYIYRTSNGGTTWIEEGSISSTYDSDMQLTSNSGYIAGKIGSFYKRSGSTSTKEAIANVEINLFPIPVKSGQTITWNSSEMFTNLSIIDQVGKTIHQQSLNQNHATLPNLAAGFYFVQLLNDKVLKTIKLIVE